MDLRMEQNVQAHTSIRDPKIGMRAPRANTRQLMLAFGKAVPAAQANGRQVMVT